MKTLACLFFAVLSLPLCATESETHPTVTVTNQPDLDSLMKLSMQEYLYTAKSAFDTLDEKSENDVKDVLIHLSHAGDSTVTFSIESPIGHSIKDVRIVAGTTGHFIMVDLEETKFPFGDVAYGMVHLRGLQNANDPKEEWRMEFQIQVVESSTTTISKGRWVFVKSSTGPGGDPGAGGNE